jgi:uncharacterized membrane protein
MSNKSVRMLSEKIRIPKLNSKIIMISYLISILIVIIFFIVNLTIQLNSIKRY